MPDSSPVLTAGESDRHSKDVAEVTGASMRPSGQPDLSGRAVLFATDGSPSAIAAAHVAQKLARKYGAAIHVLSVIDTRAAAVPPPLDLALGIADVTRGSAIHAEQAEAVRARIAAAIDERVDCPSP
jgi:nucleotide-binding universal stress UspA family protein